MLSFIPHIKLQVNEVVFNKDPDSSELGKKIIKGSIEMIFEIGFEEFTFKKLGIKIKSTEASIYRYFDNKYSLLHYLTIWYWRWMEYKLIFWSCQYRKS
jgi:AcrR family transcriptional regulator